MCALEPSLKGEKPNDSIEESCSMIQVLWLIGEWIGIRNRVKRIESSEQVNDNDEIFDEKLCRNLIGESLTVLVPAQTGLTVKRLYMHLILCMCEFALSYRHVNKEHLACQELICDKLAIYMYGKR